MRTREVLSKKRFQAWLTEKGRKRVGKAQESDTCPIACYIKETIKADQVDVDSTCIEIDNDRSVFNLPRWVSNFVDNVDKLGRHEFVTGLQALKILNKDNK